KIARKHEGNGVANGDGECLHTQIVEHAQRRPEACHAGRTQLFRLVWRDDRHANARFQFTLYLHACPLFNTTKVFAACIRTPVTGSSRALVAASTARAGSSSSSASIAHCLTYGSVSPVAASTIDAASTAPNLPSPSIATAFSKGSAAVWASETR